MEALEEQRGTRPTTSDETSSMPQPHSYAPPRSPAPASARLARLGSRTQPSRGDQSFGAKRKPHVRRRNTGETRVRRKRCPAACPFLSRPLARSLSARRPVWGLALASACAPLWACGTRNRQTGQGTEEEGNEQRGRRDTGLQRGRTTVHSSSPTGAQAGIPVGGPFSWCLHSVQSSWPLKDTSSRAAGRQTGGCTRSSAFRCSRCPPPLSP
jgi:hypothetical protein